MEFDANDWETGMVGAGRAELSRIHLAGERARRCAWLLGSVSVLALAQVMGSGTADATSGPCAIDTVTTPGTYLVTCTGTITGGSDPAVYITTNDEVVQINSDATISTSGNSAYGIFLNR